MGQWKRRGMGVAAGLWLLGMALIAGGHPLGNASVNHYAGLSVERGALRVDYRIDFAEIPSMAEMRALDANGDGQIAAAEKDAYLATKVAALARGLRVMVDGAERAAEGVGGSVVRRRGAGDLPTVMVLVNYRVPLGGGRFKVVFIDENYPDRPGWKEIVTSAGDGMRLRGSTAMAVSRSAALTAYPAELTAAPPDVTSVRLEVEELQGDVPVPAAAGPIAPSPRGPTVKRIGWGTAGAAAVGVAAGAAWRRRRMRRAHRVPHANA